MSYPQNYPHKKMMIYINNINILFDL